MKTQIKTITPQWAKRILETRNPHNRRISEVFVSKMARDIANGAFVATHQGIAFNESGDLLDGQHRLAAVVMANKPITIPVTTGVPAMYKVNGSSINTFELIDGGKPRAVGQMLQMAGFANGNKIAAAVKAAVLLCSGRQANVGLSTAQTHKAMMYFGDSVSACVSIASSGTMFKPQSWIVGPVAIYHTVNPVRAESFLKEVGDVTGVAGSPSRALATYSRSHHSVGGKQQIAFYRVTASALWHDANSSRVSKIYANEPASQWLVSLNKPLAQKLSALINL